MTVSRESIKNNVISPAIAAALGILLIARPLAYTADITKNQTRPVTTSAVSETQSGKIENWIKEHKTALACSGVGAILIVTVGAIFGPKLRKLPSELLKQAEDLLYKRLPENWELGNKGTTAASPENLEQQLLALVTKAWKEFLEAANNAMEITTDKNSDCDSTFSKFLSNIYSAVDNAVKPTTGMSIAVNSVQAYYSSIDNSYRKKIINIWGNQGNFYNAVTSKKMGQPNNKKYFINLIRALIRETQKLNKELEKQKKHSNKQRDKEVGNMLNYRSNSAYLTPELLSSINSHDSTDRTR